MPPRKKANSSSKRSHSSQSQPTKFGIQHFFERHTQSFKNVTVSSTPQNPKPDLLNSNSKSSPFSISTIPKNASDSVPTKHSPNSALENTPPDNVVQIDDKNDSTQTSPEVTKSISLKRFKFSPEMVNHFFFFLISTVL